MALDDAGLGNNFAAALENIHGNPDAQNTFGSVLTTYAAGAQLNAPGTGLVSALGPVGGAVIAVVTFDASVLTSGLNTLWGSNHSRADANSLMTSAIIAYVNTATAQVNGSAGFTNGLVGIATTGTPTFDVASFTAAMNALWAQDNSAAFAAAALTAAVKALFRSGTLPVPGSYYEGPNGLGTLMPVSGQATGSIF